jgi:hypothetical protein
MLKGLALSMHNYHDTYGKLPPAVVYGKDGRPLYSWRVLLLPFLEQRKLYDDFHLDEPWDSPHNIKLLPRIPFDYIPPGSRRKLVPLGYTFCHVFVGQGTPFEEGRAITLKDISQADGTSNTLLLVEGGPPVPWTKPEDIGFAPDKPLPKLNTVFEDGFRASLVDGSSFFVTARASDEAIRAAITWNGGERIPLPDR